MKRLVLLISIGWLSSPVVGQPQSGLDNFLREYHSAPHVSWIVPLPYRRDAQNANPLEEPVLQHLAKRGHDEFIFWDGSVSKEIRVPGQPTNATLMPKLQLASEMRVLAAEMLFYPEVKDSPFSGDLLKGTVGHRPSGSFLFGLLHDPRQDSERASYVVSTAQRATSKNDLRLWLAVEGRRARTALLVGTDVFAFIHLYGHGIQNEHRQTAMVLPRHELSNATFTGLTNDSLITAAEALETFLNAAVGLPEEFIPEGLIPAEDYQRLVRTRRAADARELNAGARKRKVGIVIVMETCSVLQVKSPTGEKRPHTRLSAAAGRRAIEEVVRKDWLDRFESYLPLRIETEVHVVDVAEPGRRLAVAIDHNKWDLLAGGDRTETIVVEPDGRQVRFNPLNYGVLTARIPFFIEESVYAASVANVPYRVSDVVNDIQYYRTRYLSDKARFRSPMDEFVQSAPLDYWRRLADRHATKPKDDNSVVIVNPDFAQLYVRFEPGTRVGPSNYEVQMRWHGSTRWDNPGK